jgi:hypothetical protein
MKRIPSSGYRYWYCVSADKLRTPRGVSRLSYLEAISSSVPMLLSSAIAAGATGKRCRSGILHGRVN